MDFARRLAVGNSQLLKTNWVDLDMHLLSCSWMKSTCICGNSF